jgi:RHS repeat-associated protein
VYDATPAGEVDFTAPEDRTDVPTNSTYGGDLACSSGANCDVISPTFWSKFDLTTIQAKSLEGSSLQAVDSWSLAKTYPDPHDSTSTPTLWLSSITRTGKDGTTTNLQLPPVKFTPEAMPNRVETQQDLNDGYSIITRMRMYKVTNETGGVITVTYDTPPSSCTSGNFPAEDSNSTLCFPDFWTPPNKSSPIEDWFNKYVVSTVTQADVVVGGSPVVTNYSYKGAAWHYNDDALSRSKNRTWDQWRGFRTVTTETGAAPDPVTQTVDTYFQGMDGDYQSGGGTSSASLTSSLGGQKVTDSDQFAGMDFEHIVYDGAGGGVVTDTVTVPWTSAATADQNQPSPLPDLKAFLTGTALTQTFTALAAGGYREADDTFTHDSAGRVTVEAKVPDTADASEDTCTQTSYATPSSGNPDSNLTDLAAEVIVTSVAPSACPVSGTPAKAELVSDTRSYYDGATTLGVLPGAGDVTMTKLATSYNGTAEVFTMRSQATYDQYGRVTSATDADNNTTTTSYTPATGAEPTSVTVTDPMSLATTTTYDPGRDLPLTVTSPAGYISTEQYDSLGRLTSAWKPRNPAGGLANETFSYTVSNNSPSIVTTNTLNVTGSYVSSDALYDSLGRQIETQSQTSDGSGMDVSDTYYNSDGWRATVSNPYYVQFNPGNNVVFGNLVQAVGGAVPSQTRYTYDGDGRVTAQAALTNGKETWETDTSYGGNYTTVNPPAGGTAETTYTDGNGQTSYIYSYHAANPPASPPAPGTGPKTGASGWDETGYSYTPAQQLSGITDTAGNQWSYAYNLAGYRTSATDPDSGTTTSKYDPNGNPLQVTDARNDTISYTYDADNRKTAEYDITGGAGQTGSDQLAAWTYDTLAPGLLTSATAYGPGGTSGTSYTDAVRGYGKWGLPTGNNVSISAGPFAGTYTQLFGYNANTQQENSYTDYAVPGLPTETVTVGLDNLNRPAGVTGTGATALLQYNELSQPAEYSMGASTLPVTVSDTYDPETGLLKTSQTQTGLSNPQTIAATTYNYDNAGLVTSESDNPANGPVQVQCFNYDYLGRLTTAWSQGSTGCSGGPSQAAEAGAAAPYWDAYQYNAVNDLTSVTSTPPTGGATTTTSSFPAAGSAQPHAVSAQQVAGPGHNLSTSYGYNAAGDTTSVSNSAGGQTLSWNDAGKLASVTTTGLGAGTTSYVYDANGNLLLRKGPSGTTLFLPDEEITQSGSTTVGTRYYSIGGVTVASMSNGTVNYLSGDTQGTATIAVDGSSLTPAYRYYDPFGNPVGPAPSAWLGVRGFVGGDTDTATGLTNLGAREYAPATQSFLSPDALINPDNPQDLNAYAYASDSPAAFSDPSGMYLVGYGSGCDTNCGGSSGGSNGNSGGGNGGWGSGGRTNPWPYGPPGDVHTTMFEDPPVHVVRTPRAVTPMGSAIGGGVCTGILFRLGACYSERYAAGSTPGQVKQSLIGAVGVLSIVVPLGDIADAIGGVLGGIFRGGSIAADEATVVNAAGRAYPSVTDLRTGEPIPAPPSGLTRVPVSDRVPWGPQERGAFIKQWYDQGYQTPEGGWGQYDIHHIIPREYGGTNDFENLTPVLRTVHQTGFNPWWMGYGG